MGRSNLSGKINSTLEDFVNRLKSIYGPQLVSVMLYGSAASGEHTGYGSNVNLAIILNNASMPDIARVSKLINNRKFRIISPVFFTEKYIASSVDVFPVEFLDMKENHTVLYGKDCIGALEVDLKNLRFQCEQELKSKLINIKTAYLNRRSASDRKKLLFKFFTSCLHILRNILRLKGRVPPYSKQDVAKEVAKEFKVDIAVLQKILDAKNKDARLKGKDAEDLLFNFIAELEKIAEAVDKI